MTLLIVEDEDIIRKGLIITIRKLQLDFASIYEARDGREALNLCKEFSPDIVLTDIRMPLMDGLTFIKESQPLIPNSQFIILSGYNDFQYARTALQYGVKDYLLKPSTKNEINDVLLRVMENIRKEEAGREELNRYQGLLLGNILLGRYPSDEIEHCLTHYSIRFADGLLAVVCFKILPGFGSEENSIDYRCHASWLSLLLNRYAAVFQADILSVYKCLILNLPLKEYTHIRQVWQEIGDEIRRYEEEQNIILRISVSSAESSPACLPKLYGEAILLLHYRLFLPDIAVFDSKNFKRSDASEPAVPLTMIETLYHCFLGKSQFDLRQSFYAFLHHVEGLTAATPQYLLDCLEKTEEYFSLQLVKDSQTTDYPEPIKFSTKEVLTGSNTLEELNDLLYSKFLHYWKQRREGGSPSINTAASPVNHAIAYIEQNYYMDLDLGMISDLTSMSSSYFSSLFKKKTGLNFISYLQNVRIEKSKKLLLNSNQKLYEISEAVGIPNVKYFCKLFKDYTGTTPSEYRRRSNQPELPD